MHCKCFALCSPQHKLIHNSRILKCSIEFFTAIRAYIIAAIIYIIFIIIVTVTIDSIWCCDVVLHILFGFCNNVNRDRERKKIQTHE